MKIRVGHCVKVGDPMDGTFSSFGPVAEIEIDIPDPIDYDKGVYNAKKFDAAVAMVSKLARRAAEKSVDDSIGVMRYAQRRAYETVKPANQRGSDQGSTGRT